jgi:hypothetical protein
MCISLQNKHDLAEELRAGYGQLQDQNNQLVTALEPLFALSAHPNNIYVYQYE